MCGTTIPLAPASNIFNIKCGSFAGTLTTGAMPYKSAALIIFSASESVIEPCSQSINTQSKPIDPKNSTICGELIGILSPTAVFPDFI